MHKSTKLAPKTRKIIYVEWCKSHGSFRSLARRYHVDKNIIKKVVTYGRLGDFSIHDSTNKRYRTLEYGLRRLSKTEALIEKRQKRHVKRQTWIDKEVPGELIHVDTKRLRSAFGEPKGLARSSREALYVGIDDASRFLVADILPEKTGDASAIFLETCTMRMPFLISCHYSDNGSEFKGSVTHPLSVSCNLYGIKQRFTKPRHPWTNGKAERVIRTLLEEWLIETRGLNKTERRLSLYRYVEYYNHERPHRSLKGLTPFQKLMSLLESGDNA